MKLPQVEVIISLYNYKQYIQECLDSVLGQDYPHIVINIVDDGSSDDGVELIKSHYVQSDKLKITQKQNGGQLSAFNAGFGALSPQSEIVLFLDADDYMSEGYVRKVVETFRESECDMLFCDLMTINNGILKEGEKSPFPHGDLGFGVFDTYYNLTYYGRSTSCIAISAQCLGKILPLDLESDWRIRADDCIIYGAALVGARLYHLDFKGIVYRIHGENNHHGRSFDIKYEFNRTLLVQKLFAVLLERHKIRLPHSILHQEIKSKTKMSFGAYLRILILSDIRFVPKLFLLLKLWRKLCL